MLNLKEYMHSKCFTIVEACMSFAEVASFLEYAFKFGVQIAIETIIKKSCVDGMSNFVIIIQKYDCKNYVKNHQYVLNFAYFVI